MFSRGPGRRFARAGIFIYGALSLASSVSAQRLSPLAPAPEWQQLEAFHETMTRGEFVRLLEEVYAPAGAAQGLIEVEAETAIIRTKLQPPDTWTLRFARDEASVRPTPKGWRAASELGPAPIDRPLQGLRIAIDPGHLGGGWAKMEERWFTLGETPPVTEGDLTLRVADLLAPQLRALGAEVLMIRTQGGPTTLARPEMLRGAARQELVLQGVASPRERYGSREEPNFGQTIQFQSELLFFRVAEIRHRADVVNRQLRPDLTVCLHFNAEAWGNPRKPEFVPRNHLHLLVNGCYSAVELRNDDVRFDMLAKLLRRCFPEELAASESAAAAIARATGLPAYAYAQNIAQRVGESEYVWARNLLANRLYRTPVLYFEPYVMNSQPVWARVQAGDYAGERMIGDTMRKSIFREYADAVAEGLRDYARASRRE